MRKTWITAAAPARLALALAAAGTAAALSCAGPAHAGQPEAFAAVGDVPAASRVEADEAVRWECLGMLPQMRADRAAADAAQDVEPQPAEWAEPEYYEPEYPEEAYYEPSYGGGYSNDFMRDGVVHGDDGTTYKWYPSSVLYHYRTPEWSLDDEGFYRTDDGYYVVASSDYPEGTIVDTPWGEGMVLDSGCDSGTVDMYVGW